LRLGRNKVLVKVGGVSLIQRVVNVLSSFSSDIIVVADRTRLWLKNISYPRMKLVTDICPGGGALGGIYAGLSVSDSLYNVVVACDMPFLSQPLLGYMVNAAVGYDVVIPRLGEMLEPLHAVYSRDCLPRIEHQLKQGELNVVGFFHLVRVRYIGATEVDHFDPEHRSFFNVNTRADLKKARELVKVIERPRCVPVPDSEPVE
jgi:molybdopterin-guanine dinucleotide biosynthesis protein A